jgi:hypothetical protein
MILMHVLAILIAVIILTAGVFVGRNQKISENNDSQQDQVLSEQKIEEQLSGDEEQIFPSQTPTQIPSSIPSPIPSNITQGHNVDSYRYPNSAIIDSDSNSLTLHSKDSVDVITNWYKEIIENEGMSVSSFINTSANDKVLNKLVAADGNEEISVEIYKEPGSSVVKISVTVESDN